MRTGILTGAFVVMVLVMVAVARQQPPAAPPAQKPAAPAAQPAPPPRPFPEGAKVAWVNLQRIADESKLGQAATKQIGDLTRKKSAEVNEKSKLLTANQQKLRSSSPPLTSQAAAQLQKDIDRQQVEIERLQQDAQAEADELRAKLNTDFQGKLLPVIGKLALERQLHCVFTADGIVWADPGVDLTAEVVKRFDAAWAPAK